MRHSRSRCHEILANYDHRLKAASGLFYSGNGGFNGTFLIPESQSSNIFTGKFTEATPQFNTSNVTLIYDDMKDLTGSYAIQAGSVVDRSIINSG